MARDDIPPGFDHDPTAWSRRALLLALAIAGLAVAMALTLYQIGVLSRPWDPVFGERSSRAVLDLTEPVPDAGAGVLAYASEIVLLLVGPPGRWRTMPWTCLALGAVLCAGAVVSIALIVVQPAVADAWCLLCLGSAALSLALFALGIGEARAALGHLRRSRGQRAAGDAHERPVEWIARGRHRTNGRQRHANAGDAAGGARPRARRRNRRNRADDDRPGAGGEAAVQRRRRRPG